MLTKRQSRPNKDNFYSAEIVIVIVIVTEQKYLELASYLFFEGQRRIHWTVNSRYSEHIL